MSAQPYKHVQTFTSKYGTVSLKQDNVGVTGEAQVPGILIYETIWKEGPFGSIPEAMNRLDQVLEKWLQNARW
ncbi:MAG: hypothetical protein AAGD96_00930 [Chloroflexota bacterium]